MEPQLIYLGLALIAVGALSGFSAGIFGIGGGAVMVPALYYAFTALGVPEAIVMHCAVATSGAIIIVNSLRSTAAHHKRKSVAWELLWPDKKWQSYALWISAGSFIAALWIAPLFSGEALTILFAIVAALVALQFIIGRPDYVLRNDVPGGAAPPLVGSAVGALSALMGIGGGSLTVPLMSLCGVPIHRAIGTASGFGFAIALPATIGFIISGWNVAGRPFGSMGYVNLMGFIIIASVAILTIPLGAKLAHSLPQSRLKRIFGICLLLVAANMARKAMMG